MPQQKNKQRAPQINKHTDGVQMADADAHHLTKAKKQAKASNDAIFLNYLIGSTFKK